MTALAAPVDGRQNRATATDLVIAFESIGKSSERPTLTWEQCADVIAENTGSQITPKLLHKRFSEEARRRTNILMKWEAELAAFKARFNTPLDV